MLIGINYFGQKGQLRGCINDAKNLSTYLNHSFGYAREDMVILTDDQQNPMSQPTKANILRAMHWLVKDAQPNDSLFFHYSGESIPLLVVALALTKQATEVRRQIMMGTKMTDTTKLFTRSTSGWQGTLWTMRCTGSWWDLYSLVCD